MFVLLLVGAVQFIICAGIYEVALDPKPTDSSYSTTPLYITILNFLQKQAKEYLASLKQNNNINLFLNPAAPQLSASIQGSVPTSPNKISCPSGYYYDGKSCVVCTVNNPCGTTLSSVCLPGDPNCNTNPVTKCHSNDPDCPSSPYYCKPDGPGCDVIKPPPCDISGARVPYYPNKSQYYECRIPEWILRSCSPGYEFHAELLKCVPLCDKDSSDSVYHIYEDCRSFVYCTDPKTRIKCPAGMTWHCLDKTCTDTVYLPCCSGDKTIYLNSTDKCSNNGSVALNHENTATYFQCKKNKIVLQACKNDTYLPKDGQCASKILDYYD